MARKSHHPAAAETLEEIQSAADQLAEWIRTHLWLVVGSIAALLVVAAGIQFATTQSARREEAASAALARVRADYLAAMGAPLGSLEVPELANPQAAASIRSEYVERYGELAAAHRGTVSGALALVAAGDLLKEGGDTAGAIEMWEELLRDSGASDGVRGIALERVASAHEDAGSWLEAGARHEQAAALSGYPLRYWALADAARCFAAAGDDARALALYDRLEAEAPELRLPDHQQQQRRALQAEASSSGS
jgi:hypothetical protein